MTVIKIIDAFTFYGFDILLLAVLTAATVQIFKLTFLKKCKNKLYTFLPFGLGAFYYAAYTVLVNWNFTILLDGYTDILEHGFSVGSLATLLYVLYEQFVRDKKASTPAEGIISTLIEEIFCKVASMTFHFPEPANYYPDFHRTKHHHVHER